MSTTSPPRAMAWLRVGNALLASSAEAWARSWEIGVRHARLGTPEPGRAVDPSLRAVRPARTLIDTYRHYATEMAMVPWLALERFRAEAARGPDGQATTVTSVEGRRLPVPTRIYEAAQGLAVYAVPLRAAQEVLDDRGLPFVAVPLPLGWTALAITGVRYLASDLGAHHEVGFALLVAPRHQPAALGLYFIEFPVNRRFPYVAGRAVWGYTKTEALIDVSFETSRASWTLRRKDGTRVLTMAFPRGGASTSRAIPLHTYTMLRGRPHRAVLTRTGRGERIRFGGGQVSLALGDPRTGAGDGLVRTLHRLGLPAAPLLLHGWTEHMSGELAGPLPLSGR